MTIWVWKRVVEEEVNMNEKGRCAAYTSAQRIGIRSSYCKNKEIETHGDKEREVETVDRKSKMDMYVHTKGQRTEEKDS